MVALTVLLPLLLSTLTGKSGVEPLLVIGAMAGG